MATLYRKQLPGYYLRIACKDLPQGVLNYPRSYTFYWTLAQNGVTIETAQTTIDVGDTEAVYLFTNVTKNQTYDVTCVCKYNYDQQTEFTARGTFTADDCEIYVSLQIKYDANGGTGAPSNRLVWEQSETLTKTILYTVPDTVPTKTGYVFAGWDTVLRIIYADSHETETALGTLRPGETASFTAMSIDEAAPIYTLTAIWREPTNAAIWDGSAWVPATPYVFDGTEWAPAAANVWDGSAWQS